jgi:hypothetical protein
MVGFFLMFSNSCKKEETSNLPTVTTSDVWYVMSTFAYGEGNVTNEGTSGVTHKGVCWGLNSTPTLSGNYSDVGFGPGSISSKMDNLSPSTKYYVRAYATNSSGTAFGKVVSFTTTP